MLSFIGAAATRDTGEIKNIFKETVLPKNPEEKREVLIQELKKNLREIKEVADPGNYISQNPKSSTAINKNTASSQNKIKELISSSENAIEKLEESNGDKSITEKITERVIEIILPGKEKTKCVLPKD